MPLMKIKKFLKKIYALDKELEKKTNSVLEDLNNSKIKLKVKFLILLFLYQIKFLKKYLVKKKSNLGDFKKFLEDVK